MAFGIRSFGVMLFAFVFSAGVTCAVVCPEETIDPHLRDEGGECTQCISTHFMASAKTSDEQLTDDSMALKQELPIILATAHAENIAMVSKVVLSSPYPQVASTVSRI
jgi:hypothetical protein